MARSEKLTGNSRISVRRKLFKTYIVVELEWEITCSHHHWSDFKERETTVTVWRDATVDDFANGRVQIGVLK